MALMRSKDVPKDAVILNEMEATTYAWDMVTEWKSLSDTWALLYGPAILGGVNAVSGLIINKHYRTKLKLGQYGYLSSVIPITVMPAMLTALFHRYLISTPMILMQNEACPICYEIKSAVIQCGLGVAYPMLLAPTSAMMFASRYATFRVPLLNEGPKVVFNFLRKITKPMYGVISLITVTQFVASSAITYFEMRNNFTLRRKILEVENKVSSEMDET